MSAVAGDGTAVVVELQFGQVDVRQGAERKHQDHLCLPTCQL